MTKKDITTYYKDQLNDLIVNGNYNDDQKDLINRIMDYDGDLIEDLIFYDDKNDLLHEIADNCVDIYHANRFKWLSYDTYTRSSIIEDALTEYGYDFNNFNLSDIIAVGQFKFYFDLLNDLIGDLRSDLKQFNDNDDNKDQ
jgi:hypothetical protein